MFFNILCAYTSKLIYVKNTPFFGKKWLKSIAGIENRRTFALSKGNNDISMLIRYR
jgi:hypothetical protein